MQIRKSTAGSAELPVFLSLKDAVWVYFSAFGITTQNYFRFLLLRSCFDTIKHL